MRTILLTLAALAACSGDDTGDGPGVDGGDPFVGYYTAEWNPDLPEFIRFGCVTIPASDPDRRILHFYHDDPGTMCGLSSDTSHSGAVTGGCVVDDDEVFYAVDMCVSDAGLSGTITDYNDGSPIVHSITMTRR